MLSIAWYSDPTASPAIDTVSENPRQRFDHGGLTLTVITALTAVWVGVIALAPWLPVPLAGFVYLLGGRICHQIAERSFHVAGAQLPVCARCLGVYVGTAVVFTGVFSRTVGRARPRLWVCGALALNAVTLGMEWMDVWSVTNTVRAGAGVVLGAAVAVAIRWTLSETVAPGQTAESFRAGV
jgi:uncharacterized membrane protein